MQKVPGLMASPRRARRDHHLQPRRTAALSIQTIPSQGPECPHDESSWAGFPLTWCAVLRWPCLRSVSGGKWGSLCSERECSSPDPTLVEGSPQTQPSSPAAWRTGCSAPSTGSCYWSGNPAGLPASWPLFWDRRRDKERRQWEAWEPKLGSEVEAPRRPQDQSPASVCRTDAHTRPPPKCLRVTVGQ